MNATQFYGGEDEARVVGTVGGLACPYCRLQLGSTKFYPYGDPHSYRCGRWQSHSHFYTGGQDHSHRDTGDGDSSHEYADPSSIHAHSKAYLHADTFAHT